MPRVNERLWRKAESAVAPNADRYEDPWAVVETVYQRMLAAEKRRGAAAKKKKPHGGHCCAKCEAKAKRQKR